MILLEPGAFERPDFAHLDPSVDWQPRDKPLRGVDLAQPVAPGPR